MLTPYHNNAKVSMRHSFVSICVFLCVSVPVKVHESTRCETFYSCSCTSCVHPAVYLTARDVNTALCQAAAHLNVWSFITCLTSSATLSSTSLSLNQHLDVNNTLTLLKATNHNAAADFHSYQSPSKCGVLFVGEVVS